MPDFGDVTSNIDKCAHAFGTGRSQQYPFFSPARRSVKEVEDGIWLVSFMNYDLGYVDLEEKTLQPLGNPFGPKV